MPEVIDIYKILHKSFGLQKWWPADSPFEVVIGAILTQSTNWRNVEKAILNLKNERSLTPNKLIDIKGPKLEKLIRPAGYFRAKAKKLKAFVNHLYEHHHGKLENLFGRSVPKLREELLSIHGIGPETADSIILYAANRPSFVVDAYTKRIGHRTGLFKFSGYTEIKEYFEKNLPKSVKIYNECHALLVELGKRYCRKRPECLECPVRRKCGHGMQKGR